MTLTASSAVNAMEAGRQHWRAVVKGEVAHEIPFRKANVDMQFVKWFAKGAVEEMDKMAEYEVQLRYTVSDLHKYQEDNNV